MNLNSSPSPFPMPQIGRVDDPHYQSFGPNPSSSLSCHFFFNSTQDHTGGYYDHHPLYHPQHNSDDNYGYNQGGSTYEIKNKVDSGLKLTLWKKEDHHGRNNPVKWMSSKMRVMQKMKSTDRATDEDPKMQPSSSLESTDLSSNNSSSYNNNSPIRVCADCNTTKTPLWRSGPKGPKSLCNACGIRQRKARRAMAAAAAAAASGTTVGTSEHLKIRVQQKEKTEKNGHVSQFKKRCKTVVAATKAVGSPSNGKKKIGFEDFLINVSKNLAFHRVFPEDEKDAAILLMALSSGLVND